MVFKRRDRLPFWNVALRALWPKGGWGRAARYVQYRLRRLPDTPEKICRGIWAGVFVAFTPFYGLHFIAAALIAKIMRGNILASLLATFFGNPLTYVPIGIASLQTGYWLLGARPQRELTKGWAANLPRRARIYGTTFWPFFTHRTSDWSNLTRFYNEVFFPYLIGGLLPGIVAATTCYYIALSLVRAYQNRRKKQLRAKLEKLRAPGGQSGAP